MEDLITLLEFRILMHIADMNQHAALHQALEINYLAKCRESGYSADGITIAQIEMLVRRDFIHMPLAEKCYYVQRLWH